MIYTHITTRVAMSENLTITKADEKEKREVTSGNYRGFLRKYFNLDIEIKRLEE